MRKAVDSKFTFVDLFAGIGGFYLGMSANNGKCLFSNEWNKYAAITYQEWTKCTNFNSSDIREIASTELIPRSDVLCAGFPCQPFSLAGVSKKNSLGREHGFLDAEQGNLFFAICDVIRRTSPKILFLENVKNLKSHDKGNTWKVIEGTLDSLGYTVLDKVIDAANWVPQHRERVYMVCFRRKAFTVAEIKSFSFPLAPENGPKLGQILESEPDPKYMLSDKLWAYLQSYSEKHRARGNGFGFGLFDSEGVARTLSARYHKDGSEILIRQKGWRNPRRLTPRECCHLMGFTDELAHGFGFDEGFPIVVSDTQAYKQFGNSVSPLVVRDISAEIVKVLKMRSKRIAKRTPSKLKTK